MTSWMWVFGSFGVWTIVGYARWVRRMDAQEQYRQRCEALRRVTGS